MLHFDNLLTPAAIARQPASNETSRVVFCNHTWGESKKEITSETSETIALVGPTSEDVPLLLIYFLGWNKASIALAGSLPRISLTRASTSVSVN